MHDMARERPQAPPELPPIADGFGERLKQARIEAGYTTQPELARAMEVNLNTVSRHESGRHQPTLDLLYAYSRVLGVSVSYLQHGNPPPPAVLSYLESDRAKQLLDETCMRLREMPWSFVMGDEDPDEFQVDALAALIDRNLRKKAIVVDGESPPRRSKQSLLELPRKKPR